MYLADEDALVWQVLETIETATRADASSRGLEVVGSVDVEHATGKYDRDTVAEARDVSQHNDFPPGRVGLQLTLAGTDTQPGSGSVRVSRFQASDPLTVEVDDDSPSEVDRVLAVLRESVSATPGATVGTGRAEGLGRDSHDSRKFQLTVPDDAALWQVLASIETTGTDLARGRGVEVSTKVAVEHATGQYDRDTVAEARTVSQRNDFPPGRVRLQLSPTGRYSDSWVQASRFGNDDPLTVEVTEGDPSEADRVLAVLKESAAASGAIVSAGRDRQLTWRDRDTRKFQIPLPDEDATLWHVLETIEASAREEAAAKRHSLVTELRVGDASGEYTRSTVAEAKDTLARNDMVPRSIDFRLTFKPPGATSSWRPHDEGISVRRYDGDRPLSVEIGMEDEAELNRMFTALQETFDAELRTSSARASSLGSTDQDTRKFLVETADDALLWRVLEAVASAAEDAARHGDRTVAATLSIGHSTGEYVRSTVAEAKATSRKNGFAPESVSFRLFRIGPDADLTLRKQDSWIRVSRDKTEEPLVIEILSGNEIEVSGVFNKLQDHVKAAIQSTQGGTNNAVLVPPDSTVPPEPLWKRVLNHGWTVEVVGGLTAAVGGGLIIAWIVSR